MTNSNDCSCNNEDEGLQSPPILQKGSSSERVERGTFRGRHGEALNKLVFLGDNI